MCIMYVYLSDIDRYPFDNVRYDDDVLKTMYEYSCAML